MQIAGAVAVLGDQNWEVRDGPGVWQSIPLPEIISSAAGEELRSRFTGKTLEQR